jgi:inorganic triphosphatase YgiF
VTDHLEIERTYEVDAAFELPSLSDLGEVDGPQERRLDATYYDTADLRLLAAKVTFRRRTGGDDAGWHVKLPAGIDARKEVRRELSDSIPADLVELVAGISGGSTLAPAARISTRRLVWTLGGDVAGDVAEICDDRVTASVLLPGHESSQEWRELEVELLSGGDRSAFAAVEERLFAAGARSASIGSKLGRLLGPYLPA